MDAELVFLDETERDEVIDAAWREFQPSRPREAQFAYVRGTLDSAWGRRHCRIAGLRSPVGELLGSMSLLDLSWRLDNRRLRLGGIGGVRVKPEIRKQGWGRLFMSAVDDWLQGEGYDGAVLFSSIGPGYYQRLGYVELALGSLIADLRDYRTVDPTGPTSSRIRPYEDRDFGEVRNLYNTASSLQRLALLRDDEYWESELLRVRLRDKLLVPRSGRSRFLVGERDGRVVSYLRVFPSPDTDVMSIQECGFEAGAREDVPAMLRSVLEELEPAAPKLLRGGVPTRIANLVPSNRVAWKHERASIMMMKSYGGFDVPVDLAHDERFAWPCDRF